MKGSSCESYREISNKEIIRKSSKRLAKNNSFSEKPMTIAPCDLRQINQKRVASTQ